MDDPTNAWDNVDESEEMFINIYYLFLDTDFAYDDVIDHGREFKCLQEFQVKDMKRKKVAVPTVTMMPMKIMKWKRLTTG